MKRAILDIESNALLNSNLTTIHSLVLRDIDSDTVISCANQPGYTPIAEGLKAAARCELLVGHNIIAFDHPAILRLYPDWLDEVEKPPAVFDTMVATRFLWAHIEQSDYGRVRAGKLPGRLVNRHSLEAWGYRLGVLKGDYGKRQDAWERWTVDMQRYCENDTLVNKVLFLRCMRAIEEQEAEFANQIEQELAWYLAQQERNGVPFDMERAVQLQARLSAKREELGKALRAEFGCWYAKDGKHAEKTPKKNNKKRGITAGCPYTKLKVVEFNPGSRDHMVKVLKERYEWEPVDFTEGGKPKLDDDTLDSLAHIPAAKKVAEYLLVSKRLGQLAEGDNAWLKLATNSSHEGGRITGLYHIHGSINQNGAITHRATHANPNMGQVPTVGAPYGKECRSLFHVPRDWQLLGSDASGLELRCLAHYMARWDDGAYGRLILEGDVHSANRDALGYEGKPGRDKAKTFIYAWLYGAGDWKIGHTLEPLVDNEEKKSIGAKKKKQFLKNTPALRFLSEAVKSRVIDPKYVLMPDGRRAHIRHAHAGLNTLLQGAGAIICKAWIVEFNRRMTARFGPQGWTGKWAGMLWVHDEIQVAVRPEIADEATAIAVDAIRSITELFSWRIPLDGEAKLGGNWADTH